METDTKKHQCKKCDREFPTSRGLMIHLGRAHSRKQEAVVARPVVESPEPVVVRTYVPEPPKRMIAIPLYDHNLEGGRGLQVGDVVVITQRMVIREITQSLENSDARVKLEKIKGEWSRYTGL